MNVHNIFTLKQFAICICLFSIVTIGAQNTLPKANQAKPKEIQEVQPRVKIINSAPSEVDSSTRAFSYENKKVVITPDKMPMFEGGQAGLNNFIENHLIYPTEAKAHKSEGIVVVTFTIEPDGRVTEPEIVMDKVGNGANEEVLRLMSLMPRWAPGYFEGNPITVTYSIPVNFKLK